MKKSSKKMKALAFILSLAMIVCAGTFGPASSEVQAASGKVTSVTVTNLPAKTLTLKKGKSKVLKVNVKTSSKKVSKAYTFKSSNSKIVSVAASGKNIKVTAKSKGKATITIKSKVGNKKTSIKVTVGTPASKITMNKATATINIGKTVRLQASVSPKKASNKNIIWKSSNKKVATVTSKGVVKGIQEGNAKITAYAADGSGKKKTCIVTVKENISLKSISVMNNYSMKVTLSDAKQLTDKNFTVKTKKYEKGSYNRVCKIDNIITSDKKTYYVTLESVLYEQDMVQVSISGLSGTKTLEVRYEKAKTTTQEDIIFTATYNEKVADNIAVGKYGCSKIVSVSGLPKGISAKMSEDGKVVQLYGKSSVKGKYNGVITTQDELGNTEKCNITYLIGASDKIVAGATTLRGIIDNSYSINKLITTCGGSGEYKYEITGTNYGLSMSQNYVKGSLKAAGKYNVSVKVTDVNNTKLTTTATLTIELKQGITVTGLVKDASGNPLPGAEVCFTNRNEADLFFVKRSTTTDSKGVYSIVIIPGTYDIYANKSYTKKYQYSVKFSSSKSGLDFSVPVHKIIVYSADNSVLTSGFGYWYDANDKNYGSGDTLYLKAGSYTLTTSGTSFLSTYVAKITMNVTKAQSVKAVITKSKVAPEGSIVAGDSIETKLTGQYKYYKFVPTQTGIYNFYSLGNTDTYGILYDDKGVSLMSNDDSGEGSNFYFSYNCTAGQTYYFAVRKYSTSSIISSSATICLEKGF